MTMTHDSHDLPELPLSWSFHPRWQLAGPASSSFLEEMGLPQTSPNSKTTVIHQLGISARGPSFPKLLCLLGLLDPNGCSQHKLQEWWMIWLGGIHFLGGEPGLFHKFFCATPSFPLLVIGYHVPQPKTKQVSR
jgi:hypothetical protein